MTVGNGTLTAKYVRQAKSVTIVFIFVLGSTSAVGAGTKFTLPLAVNSWITDSIFGPAMFTDAAINLYGGFSEWDSAGGAVNIRGWRSDGTYTTFYDLQSTVPFTWGTGDIISTTFTYETSA
jgi:hypothetical protein